MAGAGYKLFNSGDVLTAAQVNTYLMEQTVMVFNDAAARTTALSGVLAEGMISYLKDTNATEVYNGSAWVGITGDGDITGVTAGTGISGGGTTGTVTITNDMATTITAKGDIVAGTGNATYDNLAAGSNGDSLYAASGETTGLRYNPPVASLANPVINGGMDVWQRGTSISVSASTTPYTADRWQIATGANQASTVSRQATGDTTNLPNIQYAARIQRNSGQTGTSAIPFVQSFETTNSIPLAGKVVTVSFYARKGADYSASSSQLGLDLISGTGTDQNRVTTGYTGNANVFSSGVTLTTSWQRFALTGTVPATATELATYFIFTPTGTASTNDYFELTGVQIDVGTWTASTAPTFRRSGATLAGELAACQRYYQRLVSESVFGAIGIGQAISGTEARIVHKLNTSMRAAPTITGSSIAITGSSGTSIAVSSISLWYANTHTVVTTNTVSSGLTAGNASIMTGNNFATGFVDFSAEL